MMPVRSSKKGRREEYEGGGRDVTEEGCEGGGM